MSTGAKYVTALVVGILLLFAVSASCSSGEKYYHVPGVEVEVDVDKGRKHYKPAPKPAPKSGGSVGRKR